MYYSLQDNQCDGRIMAICRNSKQSTPRKDTLEDMFWEKMEYHSIDEMENEETGRLEKWHYMYHKTVRGMVDGLVDFGFTIVKHETPFPENYDEPSDIPDQEIDDFYESIPDYHDLSYDEAVKEFDGRYKEPVRCKWCITSQMEHAREARKE